MSWFDWAKAIRVACHSIAQGDAKPAERAQKNTWFAYGFGMGLSHSITSINVLYSCSAYKYCIQLIYRSVITVN